MENSLSKYIILTEENMAKEHICCAFSDKKCTAGYELKREVIRFKRIRFSWSLGGQYLLMTLS